MDYQLSLEKAVLEYASSAAMRMKTRPDKYLQIPGYPDVHVWELAVQLHKQGLLTASIPEDQREVGVTHICESGKARLKELRAQALQRAGEKTRLMEEEIERNRQARLQKKWWRRVLGGRNVSA